MKLIESRTIFFFFVCGAINASRKTYVITLTVASERKKFQRDSADHESANLVLMVAIGADWFHFLPA